MGFKVLTIYFLLNLNDSPLDLGRNTSFISDFTLHKHLLFADSKHKQAIEIFPTYDNVAIKPDKYNISHINKNGLNALWFKLGLYIKLYPTYITPTIIWWQSISQQDTLWKIFWRHIISDESPMFSLLWVACKESLDQNTTSLQDHRAACYTAMIFFSRLFDPRSQSSYKALNLRYTAFKDYCIESRLGQRIHIGRVFIEDLARSWCYIF